MSDPYYRTFLSISAFKLVTLSILWTVTVLTHGWLFWLLLLITLAVTWFVVGHWVHRNISPWRRIYFPLIDRYSFLGAAHVTFTDLTNTQFDPLRPLSVLLKERYQDWSDAQIAQHLEQWKRELDGFECREFFAQVLNKVGQSMDQPKVNEIVMGARNHMLDEKNYNGALVRYVIGQLIERKVGLEQKKKYWQAVLWGKVV